MAPSDTQSPTPQRTTMFACDQCPVAYGNPSHLDRHRQIHAEHTEQANVERAYIERANAERANAERANAERANAERANAERANAERNRNSCPHCQGRFTTSEVLQRHIDAYHFAESTPRNACQRCLRFKLKCDGYSPCGWCARDAISGKCMTVAPQIMAAPVSASALPTAAPAYAYPTTPPRRQAYMQRSWSARPASPDAMPIQQDQPSHARQPSASSHLSADWNTPGAASPTDSILSLPPRLPAPGEVDIRAGSLCWLDFEVSCVRLHGADVQIVGGADNNSAASGSSPPVFRYSSMEPADTYALESPSSSSLTYGSLMKALDSLGLLFKVPYLPQVAELSGSELKLLPGIELLRQLVDNYFLKWQNVQPIFHVATCKLAKSPMVLLGAMACIGALLDDDEETVCQAHLISSRCVSELNIMAITRPENGLDIMYLAAVCLHQTYLLGSGDEHIHHHVDRIRTFLISSLQSLKLLGAGISDHDDTTQTPEESPQSVHAKWTAWVAREHGIRTTWAVFEYDCSLSLLTNRPCAIDLKDLPQRFPCSDELYEAPDAHAWSGLQSRSPYRAQGPLVSTVVAASVAREPLSKHVSPWSRRLCTQIFERVFRGFMRQAQRDSTIAAAQYLGLELGSVSVESTGTLLWSISFLGKSIHDGVTTAPLSTLDLVNFSSTKLIRHYTHLSVYSDVMDLITYIARAAASPLSPNSRTSLRWAQQRLIEQFAVDPYKSRQYIWHAGQMVRVANIYAVFAPCDNLRIFTAYLAILAFAKYGPPSLRDVDAVDPFPADAWSYSGEGVEAWLQAGGPARIGSCARIQAGCSTDQVMQDAYNLLYRLENWGISERFFNILIHFNDLDILDG